MKIEVELLLLLSELYKSIPHRTPKRYELIHEFASEIWNQRQLENDHCKMTVAIDVHNNNEDLFSTSTNFQLTINNIVRFEQDMPAVRCKLAFYEKIEKILLPLTYHCCNHELKIIPYHASLPLYTNDGLMMSRSYHAKCRKCKSNYYHCFSEDKEGKRVFEDIKDIDVIIFNSGVAFTKNLVAYFDKMICIGAMTFEKLGEFYKSLHSVEINPDRIETCWFIYRILHHVNVFEQWPRKVKSKELDLETLCRLLFPTIKENLQKSALQHVCDEIGCRKNSLSLMAMKNYSEHYAQQIRKNLIPLQGTLIESRCALRIRLEVISTGKYRNFARNISMIAHCLLLIPLTSVRSHDL